MTSQASRLKLVLVLTENWTMLPGTDLQGLVRMAREAEDAGFDAVMLSEHVVLGTGAGKLNGQDASYGFAHAWTFSGGVAVRFNEYADAGPELASA